MGSLRVVLTIAAACILSTPTQAALLAGLIVEPPNPVAGDAVVVTASGWLPDSCWDSKVSHECVRVGDVITITFQTTDRWRPGMVCALVVRGFAGSCELGPLEVGTYVVTVIETASSTRPPVPLVRQFSFRVRTAVRTGGAGWSALKARFGQV